MASTSILPNIGEMAQLLTNGFRIPIFIRLDSKGFATVSSLRLSSRFGLHNTSLWVEHEVYDHVTLVVFHTLLEVSTMSVDGLIV